MSMIKLLTSEQLLKVLERLGSKFLSKSTASSTYVAKTDQITIDLSNYYTKTEVANGYVAKDGSKVLSTNDFTTAYKNKLDGIAEGANNYTYTLPSATSSVLGGVKLYSSTGTNTDGTMTQAAINAALSNFSADVILGTTPLTVEGGVWAEW